MAGTVGAIFNSSLQLGSAVGIAVVTSIQTSIQQKTVGGEFKFTGRADALWFIVAVVAVEVVAMIFFFDTKVRRNWTVEQERADESSKAGGPISDVPEKAVEPKAAAASAADAVDRV